MATNITISDSKTLAYALRFLSELNPEKAWDVEVSPHSKALSVRQRNLFWKWMSEAGGELGYDKDDFAELMKDKFLAPHYIEDLNGNPKEVRKSIKRLKVGEMGQFMDSISRFCAQDLGINLTHPEDIQMRT